MSRDFYMLSAIQLLNVTLLLLWGGLAIWAFRRLRTYRLPMRAELLWTAAIIALPLIAGAFLIQHPTPSDPTRPPTP